jgi:hypothetical protein
MTRKRVLAHDRGQAVLVLLAVVVIAAVAASALAGMGATAAHRDHAQAAADAAALAGAVSGERAAARVAAANGAQLVSFTVLGAVLEVEVAYRGQHARARAARAP